MPNPPPNKDNDVLPPPPPPSQIPHVLPKFFPININLNTNLPDDKDDAGLATKIFPLTGDMLGMSANKPFFSSEIDYSYGANFFVDLPREEQIKVFFDRATFRKFITACYTKKLNEINSSGPEFIELAREQYDNEKKEALEENGIAEKNVLFMLNMLIKIPFPKKTKVKETYSNHSTSVLSVFKDPFGTLKQFYSPFIYYTYLKYEGKDYTVVKARWQNDFYSHPEFFKLYNLYRIYKEWFTEDKKKEIITRFKNDPYFTGTQLYSYEILEYIIMAFAEDFMAYEDAEDYLKTIMTFKGKTLPYKEYKNQKTKIDEALKKINTVKERQDYLQSESVAAVAIKDFEVSSRARYSKDIEKSQVADFENYKKLIKKIYDFIKKQPDWENYYELKKETLSKVKENIYNKKLRCLLSNITYLSKNAPIPPPPKEDEKPEDKPPPPPIENSQQPPDECDGLLVNVRNKIERRAFYVGVQKKGGVNGEFEITVYVDLFGGKIDQKNKGKYRCAFLGEKLGNEFEAMWNGRYYVKSRFYFDGSEFEDDTNTSLKKENESKTSKETETETSKESKPRRRNKKRREDEDSDDESEVEGGAMKRRRRHKTLRKPRSICGTKRSKRRHRTLRKRGGCGAVCLAPLLLA